MEDWKYAETDPAQRLSRVHTFTVKKKQPDREIEFTITVHEYVSPPAAGMRHSSHPLGSLGLGRLEK